MDGCERWLMRGGMELDAMIDTLKPDLIHAHDLGAAIKVAHACEKRSIGLLYDAHEYEVGRRGMKRRASETEIRALEAEVCRIACGVVTVSHAIASALSRAYGREVHVAPNAPTREVATAVYPEDRGRSLDIEIVYSGMVLPERGIAQLIEAALGGRDWWAVDIQGPMRGWHPEIEDAVNALPWAARQYVSFRPPVPYRWVVASLRGAQLGWGLSKPHCESYRMALPNKLYEYAFAGVPALHSRTPDVWEMVHRYNLGLAVDPDTVTQDSLPGLMREAAEHRPDVARMLEECTWEAASIPAYARALAGAASRVAPTV